jgi:Fic family protein
MKRLVLVTTIAAMFAGSVMTGCDSPSKNTNDAEENVAEAKQDLKEARIEERTEAQKALESEDYKALKLESESKIKDNEKRIDELKKMKKDSQKDINDAYLKSIDELEQKNNALKTKIDNYDTNQSGWDSFKREFNHDMDELGQALKDITVNNKK